MRPTGACTFCAWIACDHVGRREVEAGQPLGIEPDAHRVVEPAEQQRLADARHARQLVEHVDGGVVGDEQRRHACRSRCRDCMNCRIAAERLRTVRPWSCTSGGSCGSAGCTRLLTLTVSMSGLVPTSNADGEVVAAVVAAGRLHVDHLVDADDLRLERLGDRGLDHRGGGAGIDRGDLHLRRHDVGELRHRDAQHRQRAGERDQDRDDDGEPRPAMKTAEIMRLGRRPVRCRPAAGPARAAGPGDTGGPAARAGCRRPPRVSPSFRPLDDRRRSPASTGRA